VRAVNLIPPEARRGGHADVRSLKGPGSAVVGLLVVALVLVTLYVMASNDVSQRQSQLASLQAQLTQTQALANKLAGYTQFAALAKERVQTVREIAASRFDWHRTLSDLSKVVPANTSLTALSATVAPGSGAAGGASASTGGLRGDISAPAFELQGCTASQDDVARLMSRLRLMRGVTRVTLADAVKQASSTPATPVSGSSGAKSGCGASPSNFDLVVFFEPVPTVASPSTGPTAATPASTTPTSPTGTTPTTPTGTTPTTAGSGK
jgi:Tfp pilus assembly protein PilN